VAESTGNAGSKTLQLLEALKALRRPGAEQDAVAQGLIKNISIKEGQVRFDIVRDSAWGLDDAALSRLAAGQLGGLKWIETVEVGVIDAPPAAAPPPPPPPQQQEGSHRPLAIGHGDSADESMPEVKHVIAVGSGKGGVGKSTVSVNLALALSATGARVGLLDADVYGPSVPLMLGATGHPVVGPNEKIIPIEKHGLKLMSMGFLLAPEQAVVWRGPMIHGVVRQFLGEVDWGELDYLIVDLPPGTGDAPLSLIQALPLTAAVVVTTPQEAAVSVAQKSMSMFERMGVRILGVIENMSSFICPHCGNESAVFGRGGGEALARERGVNFLGGIPLDLRMRESGDAGEPALLKLPDSEPARAFRAIAQQLVKLVG
jgi:ATP-binding protein involved in chromosome partitioning